MLVLIPQSSNTFYLSNAFTYHGVKKNVLWSDMNDITASNKS